MAQPFEKSKFDCLPLITRKLLNSLFQESSQIRMPKDFFGLAATRTLCPTRDLLAVAFSRAAIGLPPPQAIDRAAPRNGHNPSQRLARLRGIMIRLFPD